MSRIGVVVIGRNEGDRLRNCFDSLAAAKGPIVYVDSGSTDGSVELATERGIEAVLLEQDVPFTAARARNAGYWRLLALAPDTEFVQFVDGDCQVVEGWIEAACQELESDPQVAVVCGRRRERWPNRSVYNRLCDMEWNTPVGEATECGGDAMMRCTALNQMGGFNPNLIAGEEPELCVRLRHAGYRVMRIGAEMTLHDAAITHFSQWWRRTVRSGHALAERSSMHGRGPQRDCVRQRWSTLFWSFGLPLVIVAASLIHPIVGAVLLLGYAVLAFRIMRHRLRRGDAWGTAGRYALLTVVGKFAQLCGLAIFYRNRWLRRPSVLIEYKPIPTMVRMP